MYKLRWRFEWPDRPAKYGMWSSPGPKGDDTTKAWCNNKEGLTLAAIEAKHVETKETKIIVACDGYDFINFEWMAAAYMNPMGIRGSITPLTRLLGICLVTREFRFEVFHDGILRKTERTQEEKNINYATFGR